jgi:DNA mismatch endonuclease, patch repair protein
MVRNKQTTSRIMAAVRNTGSTAEMAVRRRLWANGLRYRLGVKLPGKPDLVFPRQRVAVFIDGDLWHGNSWRVRGLPSLEAQFPTRTAWWVAKIRRNMERDREVSNRLARDGWTVLRYWESEVLADPNGVARSVCAIVDPVRADTFLVMESSPVERRRLGSTGRGANGRVPYVASPVGRSYR